MRQGKPLIRGIAVCCVIFFFCSTAEAIRVNDGFRKVEKRKSKYFTIYLESDVNESVLARTIAPPVSVWALVKNPIKNYDDYSLEDNLDMLFLAVCQMLDVRLKRFNCSVKICRDMERLSEIGHTLFGPMLPKTPGFYVAEINTLYLSSYDISLYILGHELSHAIQTNYFVVPPPQKIQEVLAGFVEYELRKSTSQLRR